MRTLERTVSLGLRVGVTLSALVVALGGVAYLTVFGDRSPAFAEPPLGLRSVAGILRGVPSLESEWIIALGIVLLIATPVLRVALLVVAFARERDVLYVGLSTLVLTVLLVSLA